MASPPPFLYDAQGYPTTMDFPAFDPVMEAGAFDMAYMHPALSGMAPTMPPLSMPYSLQAINMQAAPQQQAHMHPHPHHHPQPGFHQQLFGGSTPPPLSAGSTSSTDSLPTTVSMADIMPAPALGGSSDSSYAMTPASSLSPSGYTSLSPSPKRESSPAMLHHPAKKRKTTQRNKAATSHLPPVITKPADPKGERITCATFVWPDVSGLSKKDARLVKNRAAAFLSRQRKREEYEAMERRVMKLEAANAQLASEHTDLGGADDLRNELSKAQARNLALETEHRARVKSLEAELARARGLSRSTTPSTPSPDLARLAVLFSLGLLADSPPSSSATSLSLSTPLPPSLSGDIALDLPLELHAATHKRSSPDSDADADAEGSDDDDDESRPSRTLRLTLQRPSMPQPQAQPARRTRATAKDKDKDTRVAGQLELVPSPSDDGRSTRWAFKLSFGSGGGEP